MPTPPASAISPASGNVPQPLQESICLRGVRTHNLKNIACTIPLRALTVITGVSGSGKSSLAFETLFAEGQRRYVESLSTYARQFIARMPRPDADEITHLPPAIALEQRNRVRNARSTIGSATEINDYLRLLLARAGRVVCPDCGVEVHRESPESGARRVLASCAEGARLHVVAPVRLSEEAARDATLRELRRQGFERVFVEGRVLDLANDTYDPVAIPSPIPVLIDRLPARADAQGRLVDALESAMRLGRGRCRVEVEGQAALSISEDFACASCGRAFREPEPQLLNFGNPIGACPTCEGFGRETGIDWDKVVPDPNRSLDGGAIAPWNGDQGREMYGHLREFNAEFRIPFDRPWRDLTDDQRHIVLYGRDDWPGVKGFFGWLEERRYKVQARIMLARYRAYTTCRTCDGRRLRPEALAIRLGGWNFSDICARSVRELRPWFDALQLSGEAARVAERPLETIRDRLRYLDEVGLGYLTLDRPTRTLSGGEAQRINLATALGSALTDTLYVLDEPTVGLHPRDTDRLIGILKRLVELGNTVVVVEHDLEVIRQADHLIDIGPAAGERGGRVLYEGPPLQIPATLEQSETARFLTSDGAPVPRKQAWRQTGGAPAARHGRRVPKHFVRVVGAHEHNLRHVTVDFPLGVLCAVTGVSGSGKSTLVKSCLYENHRRMKGATDAEPGRIVALEGTERLGEMILIDQSPLARSTRSNPATFLKAWDEIRKMLAATREAKRRDLHAGHFSMNVEGGRCPVCEGTGLQTLDMHFLADIEVTCEACDGARFQKHILEIEWEGMNVRDILDLSVDAALRMFNEHRRIVAGLKPLQDVGLGYLKLGQSTSTLSGGEAQRLKVAGHLAAAGELTDATLLFDEPTTGLHPADIETLLRAFDALLDRGFSLIVIEHNIELIRKADYVIDLGPDGGDQGGLVVAKGTPEEVGSSPQSLTGRHLRQDAERRAGLDPAGGTIRRGAE